MNEMAQQKKCPRLSVVIPVYNEGGNIHKLLRELTPVLEKHGAYEIIFIDDGSMDNTLAIIKTCRENNACIKYLAFSRNFGHQLALKAGLDHARGEGVISMDGDLQHPPELIDVMVDRWKQGFDVVYTMRKDNERTGFLKRLTSGLFYNIINTLTEVHVEPGTADFRLMSRRVVDVLKDFTETPLFLRGLVPWLGFKQCGIEYVPHGRFRGISKYTVGKMTDFAISGITSFSIKPLTLSLGLGAIVSALAFIYSLYALYMKIFTSDTISGWTSVLVALLWLGGIQLIVLGIMGSYLGKLFIQSKQRPPYIVKESTCE